MRGAVQRNSYRNQQCPECGLFFHGQGLHGHILFRHRKGIKPREKEAKALTSWELLRLTQRVELIEKMAERAKQGKPIDDLLAEIQKLFFLDYVYSKGIFAEK